MSRLKVALDGRPLQSDPIGGVGRYMMGTVPLLAEHVELFVLLDARRPLPAGRLSGSVHQVPLGAPPRVPGLGWLELAVAPWLRRFDGIFHGTFNTLPLTLSRRAVLTLHDLAPQLHPEDFRPATRAAWRLYVRAAVARARVTTTVSEFIRRQIVAHFGLDPGRVQVAPDAIDPAFHPRPTEEAEAAARRLGVRAPYVVAIGGAPRRGLPVAIDAWREANEALGGEFTLAVLGESGLEPERGLVPVGFLDDEDWAALLSGARALCFPTRYEGFGLPPLEAIASGTPVVCAPVASLPEVLGDAPCWAADVSAGAIADALVRLLRDPDWHRERRDAGLERARRAPTFADSAQRLLVAYERAAA